MRGHDDLHPIEPEEARQWYLDARSSELADSSLRAHRIRLGHFVRWCDEVGIDNMNDVQPRHIERFKVWRRDDGDLNNVSLNTQLTTLRRFMRWAEGVQAVPQGFHEFVDPPTLAPKEGVRHAFMEPDDALACREWMRTFHYASRDHVTFELLWHTGCRTGDLIALDLDDYYPHEGTVWFNHRPETETPLKNGEEGERPVGIAPRIQEILNDYITITRRDVTDDYDRRPLITTRHGRMGTTTVRRAVYAASRPCKWEGECPVDKDPEECAAAKNKSLGHECPESHSPHAVRKGAITFARRNEFPIEEVSGRMDVSPDVIREHYDKNTKEQEMERRRRLWDDIEDDE
jgi:site-specific recombinase XerD